MDYCIRCDSSGDRVRLLDAIDKGGIVKICSSCSKEDSVRLINKPADSQLNFSQAVKKGSVYERLSQVAGINPKKFEEELVEHQKEMSSESTTLKDIVDRNYLFRKKGGEKVKLIDNFNWIITRRRRSKHLSRGQLAKEIKESEAAIIMIEKGEILGVDDKLVGKLEEFLNIRIRAEDGDEMGKETLSPVRRHPARVLNFKKGDVEGLTIADLQAMKAMKENMLDSEEIEKEVRKKLEESGELDNSEEGEVF